MAHKREGRKLAFPMVDNGEKAIHGGGAAIVPGLVGALGVCHYASDRDYDEHRTTQVQIRGCPA
jgi:hypothetical protein